MGLDFTIVAVRENEIKDLHIHPFDLTPIAVTGDDQLIIAQHPVIYKEQIPLGISLGPCKKIIGSYLKYSM